MAQRIGMGRQVGALQHRSVDLRVPRAQPAGRRQHLGLRIDFIQLSQLLQQSTVQRAARCDAFHQRGRVRARSLQVRGGE